MWYIFIIYIFIHIYIYTYIFIFKYCKNWWCFICVCPFAKNLGKICHWTSEWQVSHPFKGSVVFCQFPTISLGLSGTVLWDMLRIEPPCLQGPRPTKKNGFKDDPCKWFTTTMGQSLVDLDQAMIFEDFSRVSPDSCAPWKFNIAPENKSSQKESNLPSIICQGRAVKLRGCIVTRQLFTRMFQEFQHNLSWWAEGCNADEVLQCKTSIISSAEHQGSCNLYPGPWAHHELWACFQELDSRTRS